MLSKWLIGGLVVLALSVVAVGVLFIISWVKTIVRSVTVCSIHSQYTGRFQSGEVILINVKMVLDLDYELVYEFYDGYRWMNITTSRSRLMTYPTSMKTFSTRCQVRVKAKFNGHSQISSQFAVIPDFHLVSGPGVGTTGQTSVEQTKPYHFNFQVDPAIAWGKSMEFAISPDRKTWVQDYVGILSEGSDASALETVWYPQNMITQPVWLRLRTMDLVQMGYDEEIELMCQKQVTIQQHGTGGKIPGSGGNPNLPVAIISVHVPSPPVFSPGTRIPIYLTFNGTWDTAEKVTFTATDADGGTIDCFKTQPTFHTAAQGVLTYFWDIPADFSTQPPQSQVDSAKTITIDASTTAYGPAKIPCPGVSVIANWNPNLNIFGIMTTTDDRALTVSPDPQSEFKLDDITYYPGELTHLQVGWKGNAYNQASIGFKVQAVSTGEELSTLEALITFSASSIGDDKNGVHRALYTLAIPANFTVPQKTTDAYYNPQVIMGVYQVGHENSIWWSNIINIQPWVQFTPHAQGPDLTFTFNTTAVDQVTFTATHVCGGDALDSNALEVGFLTGNATQYLQYSDGTTNATVLGSLAYNASSTTNSAITVPLTYDQKVLSGIQDSTTNKRLSAYIMTKVAGKLLPFVNYDIDYSDISFENVKSQIVFFQQGLRLAKLTMDATIAAFDFNEVTNAQAVEPTPAFQFVIDTAYDTFVESVSTATGGGIYHQATGIIASQDSQGNTVYLQLLVAKEFGFFEMVKTTDEASRFTVYVILDPRGGWYVDSMSFTQIVYGPPTKGDNKSYNIRSDPYFVDKMLSVDLTRTPNLALGQYSSPTCTTNVHWPWWWLNIVHRYNVI